MGELEFITKNQSVSFEGVFSLAGLYRLLDEFFKRLGFDKLEKQCTEAIKKEGKTVKIKLEYLRNFNDYVKEVHEITITCIGIKPVDIKKNNTKKRLDKGNVKVTIDSYIKSDYETRWEGKAVYYLFRIIWQKYVWSPLISDFKGETRHNDTQVMQEVKAFLNLGKY